MTFDGSPIMKRFPLIIEHHGLVVLNILQLWGAFEGYKMIVYL
jgi:hypothetical protein